MLSDVFGWRPMYASAKAGNTKWLQEVCSQGQCYSRLLFSRFSNSDRLYSACGAGHCYQVWQNSFFVRLLHRICQACMKSAPQAFQLQPWHLSPILFPLDQENSKSRKPNWAGFRDLSVIVTVYLNISCAKLYRPYFQTVKL